LGRYPDVDAIFTEYVGMTIALVESLALGDGAGAGVDLRESVNGQR